MPSPDDSMETMREGHKTLEIGDVDSVSLERGEDGVLALWITPADRTSGGSYTVKLRAGDPGAKHPTVLVGREVEVAWVHGLNEGDPDDAPHCDLSTTVWRDEDSGALILQTDESAGFEVRAHPQTR